MARGIEMTFIRGTISRIFWLQNEKIIMITKEGYNLELSNFFEGAKGEHYVPSFGFHFKGSDTKRCDKTRGFHYYKFCNM